MVAGVDFLASFLLLVDFTQVTVSRVTICCELALSNILLIWALQFLREYSTKVDDLIKDKLEATEEKKSKEQEEKELVANSVMFWLLYWLRLFSASIVFPHDLEIADLQRCELFDVDPIIQLMSLMQCWQVMYFLQNMYAQLLPLALPAPPVAGMPGMGGGMPMPGMQGYGGMPGMSGYGMPAMSGF